LCSFHVFPCILVGMEKIDARKHNQQTQYELRKQVVRLRKRGLTNREVAGIVGITEAHASTIWQKYQKGGIEAIKPGQRGRRHGAQRVLDPEQETAVQKMLVDKAPNQLKLPFALWTRDAVRLAIKKCYGLDLPLRTISDYLKRWGFTPQKPVRRAWEQNPEQVEHWLKVKYPRIRSEAKAEKAQIHWGDEMGLRSDHQAGTSYGRKGRTPYATMGAWPGAGFSRACRSCSTHALAARCATR